MVIVESNNSTSSDSSSSDSDSSSSPLVGSQYLPSQCVLLLQMESGAHGDKWAELPMLRCTLYLMLSA